MPEVKLPEFWLRGAIPGISSYLQPVAHALLQAKEEVREVMMDFPDKFLWTKPAEVASPAFHLQHLSGVLNRLFTYARGETLSEEQLRLLKAEGVKDDQLNPQILLENFYNQVDQCVIQLQETDEDTLNDFRAVGRAQLPSTVLGLLMHGAEHTMRHMGQLLVTVRILKNEQLNL